VCVSVHCVWVYSFKQLDAEDVGVNITARCVEDETRNAVSFEIMCFDDIVDSCTARSLDDETGHCERNGTQNPEWWGNFSQLVKIEKIKSLGISRYKVELRF